MSNDNGGTFVSLVFELKWDITVIDKTHDSSYLWTGQYFYPIRSSRPEVFCKKGILRPATLLKRTRLWRRCFPVSFAKFLWIHIFTEYLPWLLLSYSKIGGQNQIFTVNLIAQSLYYIIFLYRQARLRKQKEVEIFVAEMDIWRFCWGGGRGGGGEYWEKKKKKKKPKKKHKKKKKKKKKEAKDIKETQPIFPNDFSHLIHLFLHQNLLSTIHLRYWNHVIC